MLYVFVYIKCTVFHLGCLQSTLSSIWQFFKRSDLIRKEKARYLHHHRRIIFLIPQQFRSYHARSRWLHSANIIFHCEHGPFYGFYYLRERSCSAGSSYRGCRKMTPSPTPPADPVGTCGVDNPHICNRRYSRSARCPAGSRRHCSRLLETEKLSPRLTSGPEFPGTIDDMSDEERHRLKRSPSKDISWDVGYLGDSSPNAWNCARLFGVLYYQWYFAPICCRTEYLRVTTITFVYSSTDLKKIYRWQIC